MYLIQVGLWFYVFGPENHDGIMVWRLVFTVIPVGRKWLEKHAHEAGEI